MSALTQSNQSMLNVWFRAIRPFAFPASVIPVLIGSALALFYPGRVNWMLLPIVLICALLFHSATNLINDYFDFKNNIDKEYTFGSSKVIFEGLLKPKQIFHMGVLLFAIGFALSLILILQRGMPLFFLAVIGLLGGYFYTGAPIGYKYVGLGDLLVFILMGPLMVIGAYFSLTASFDLKVFYVSLPIGFLVAAILHSNNIRDIKYDTQADIKTLASILGSVKAKKVYTLMIFCAYFSIALMIFTKILSIWSLLVFLTVPAAVKNIKLINKCHPDDSSAISFIDVLTAQLHFLFGIMLLVSIVLKAILH